MLKSLYIDGDTPFHRMSVRSKLALLLGTSLLSFVISSLTILIPLFCLSAIAYLMLGMPWREAFFRVGWVFFAILVLTVATWFLNSPGEAIVLAFRIMTLVLLAAVITATTTIGDFMDEITLLLQPLERIGLVRAADVSLALGLVIRFIPEILARYDHIREAHRARGLPMRPLTLFAPLIILTLKDADAIAMAIDARGFRGQETSKVL